MADGLGGIRTLTIGLLVWSLASMAMAAAPLVANPLTFMLLARAAVGLAQSVMMPAVSATAAQWFQPADRAAKTSSVYAWYSLGTVAGLVATPAMAQAIGWPAAFGVFGAAGAATALVAMQLLPAERPTVRQAGEKRRGGLPFDAMRRHAGELALLCWTHGVIGYGFFVLQAWVPTFLHSLGTKDLTTLGLLSAMPWLATAVVAILAGKLSGWLQAERGWTALRARRAMQATANLGGLVALLPLALGGSTLSPLVATLALTLTVALQGFNYSGYHSYVQDVAPRDAGLILGLTNTCSSLAGVAGNLAAGYLAAGSSGFSAVFALAAALYAASLVTWLAFAKGQNISLS